MLPKRPHPGSGDNLSEQTLGRPRRRGLAILLSLGLAGLGEVYAGRPRAGIVTFAAVLIVGVVDTALVFAPLPGPGVLILSVAISLGAAAFVLLRAAKAARQAPDPYLLQPYNRWYWYALAVVISLLVLQPTVTRVLRSRWVRAFRVPSIAMEPTIRSGDFILASTRPSARIPAQDGVVIVASATDDRIHTVKRVVGLPGDTLTMTQGELIRNGRAVAEPYARILFPSGAPELRLSEGRNWHLAHLVDRSRRAARLYNPDTQNWGPLLVPPDSVFVLGDNRDNSYDSRFYGAVGIDRLRGKPLVIYFSMRDSDVRWSRIGLRF